MFSTVVRAAIVAVALIVTPGSAGSASAQPPAQPPAREGFVPVDQLPEQEAIPAAPLVAGAYAIAWAVILAYLWTLRTRLARVEREMVEVARRIETRPQR
jgi:CcmD family protein